MRSVLFSIIVPVYNAEKYLNRCLDSLINNDFSAQYEILLVDDGSNDRSSEICKNYEKEFDFIRYYYKINGGSSSARNYALSHANGEYVVFIDSDDYVNADFFSCLVEAYKQKSDLYIYDYILHNESFHEEKTISSTIPYGRVTSINIIYEWVASLNQREPWAKVFNGSIIRKYHLRFDETMQVAEDLSFLINYISHINTAYIVNKGWYIHTFHRDSLIGRLNFEYLADYARAYEQLCLFCKDKGILQKYTYSINKAFLTDTFRLVSANCKRAYDNRSYMETEMFRALMAEKYHDIRSIIEKKCLKYQLFPVMFLIDRARVLYQRLTNVPGSRRKDKMSSIAIITARGGSKRIPKKNIKDFCGRPIMEYSIRAALESGIFDEVMVSTDSEEIARIAKDAGAAVPFMRSAYTSSDYATTKDVLNEVLSCYAQMGKTFQVMCCIYPTAPFVTAQKLRMAYEELLRTGADSVMPVVQFSYPPQRALVLRDGMLAYQYPENFSKRSQDLEPIYHDCGQFYFYRMQDDLSYNTDSFAPIIVPETEVQDIDNLSDWAIAEMKYRLMTEENVQ